MVDRRPASHVVLVWLALRVSYAYFGRWSQPELPSLWLLGAILLLAWFSVPALQRVLGRSFSAAHVDDWRGWYGLGSGVVIGAAFVLERNGLFFLDDDNYYQFLPVMNWAYNELRSGVLPLWNPHQLLGAPTLEVGIYALTYPPTYLSCAIAGLFSRPEWAIDVFAWMHLFAAYPAMCWAARRAGTSHTLASAAALCFTLCGFHLIVGREWYYMLPVAVWLPVSFALAARPRDDASWALSTGVVYGVLFHAGNAQMWTYCVMLFALVALTLRCNVWRLAQAATISLAIALPLLVAQLSTVYGLSRLMFRGGDVSPGLAAIVLPFDLASAPHPMAWLWSEKARLEPMSIFYGSGSLLPAAALLGCVFVIVARIRSAWHLGTLAGLLLALGRYGVLWPLLGQLPVFRDFQLPYKLMGIFAAFACIAGALTLDRWLSARGRAVAWAFCALSTLWPCFQVADWEHVWSRTAHEQPYPPLSLMPTARFLPDAPRRLIEPNPARGLTQNLATVYGLESVLGYDPFIEVLPETQRAMRRLTSEPDSALRAYGVAYVLQRHTEVTLKMHQWPSLALHLPSLPELARDDRSVLLAGSTPPQRVRANGQGLVVEVDGGPVVVKYLHRANFHADYPIERDEWDRMVVHAPPNVREVELRYRPPTYGFALALVALLLFGLIGLARKLVSHDA